MRTLSISLFAVVLAFGTSAVSAQAQPQMTRDKLVGTWRLVFWKTTTSGRVAYPLGEHPGGFAVYTLKRVFFMLADPNRKAPASATLTDAEAGSLMKSSVAYTGKYDVDPAQTPDGIKVTIHVDAAANEAINGTERVFFERVDGNEMIVKAPLALVPTTGLKSAVELHYVKAE
jgi:hypothetical protein